MSSHTRDRIRNESIRKIVEIAPIVEKMIEAWLRWFRYVWRRPIGTPIRRVNQMDDSPSFTGEVRARQIIN